MTRSAFGVVSINTLTGSAATSPSYVVGYTRCLDNTTASSLWLAGSCR
jgi:hypothetical protein